MCHPVPIPRQFSDTCHMCHRWAVSSLQSRGVRFLSSSLPVTRSSRCTDRLTPGLLIASHVRVFANSKTSSWQEVFFFYEIFLDHTLQGKGNKRATHFLNGTSMVDTPNLTPETRPLHPSYPQVFKWCKCVSTLCFCLLCSSPPSAHRQTPSRDGVLQRLWCYSVSAPRLRNRLYANDSVLAQPHTTWSITTCALSVKHRLRESFFCVAYNAGHLRDTFIQPLFLSH